MASKKPFSSLSMNQGDKRVYQELGKVIVGNNAIFYNNGVLQISNITRTWIGIFAKAPFPAWTILAILVGFAILFTKQIILIILGLAICAYSIYIIYKHNQNRSDKYALNIETNSGFVAMFSSYDEQFLINFQNAITSDFIERAEGQTIINLDNNTLIENTGNISYGDYTKNILNKKE